MSRPKALLPWRGSTVIETLISSLRDGGVERIVVVRRPEDEELAALLRSATETSTVVNQNPAAGMLSTILAGMRFVQESPGPAFSPLLVCPVDHPLLSAGSIERLLACHAEAGSRILVPTYVGRRGHPILIPESYLDALGTLDPERGLRHLLEIHASGVTEVPVTDPGILANLNTPEDYAAALGSSG